MEKLSIITVNLNNREGLIKTAESVLNQTFRNFEYIIIDGGSTDGSIGVIENYASKISYWISEPDNGIYQAMNKGIENANGEYLLFLNSGDFLVNNDVIDNVFSTDSTADILYASCNISDKGKVVNIIDPPDFITFGSIYNIGLAHQSTFIKKELFDKFGDYREDFKYHADIEFWYRTIILGGATADKINVIVSDYNLDGISTKESTSKVFLREHEIIFSHPVIKRIVPDYNKWRELEKDFTILLWVQKKKWLHCPLKFIFKIHMKFKSKVNHFS
jgi:glycosyltransferase involved in cell wall biosynthesis